MRGDIHTRLVSYPVMRLMGKSKPEFGVAELLRWRSAFTMACQPPETTIGHHPVRPLVISLDSLRRMKPRPD